MLPWLALMKDVRLVSAPGAQLESCVWGGQTSKSVNRGGARFYIIYCLYEPLPHFNDDLISYLYVQYIVLTCALMDMRAFLSVKRPYSY